MNMKRFDFMTAKLYDFMTSLLLDIILLKRKINFEEVTYFSTGGIAKKEKLYI